MQSQIEIVLPCYNPGDNWHKELLGFYDYNNGRYNISFILVNDGSHTEKIIEQLTYLKSRGVEVKFVSYPENKGKGYALRQGVATSAAEFVVYTDVDFPFTNESILSLMHTLIYERCDVVAGYRNENYYQKTMSYYRKILSKTFRFFLKQILGMSVTDTQCGLKGFNQRGKEKFLQTTINRYLFDFEFIHSAEKDKTIVLKTVQVQLKTGIIFSKMKLKVLFQELFNLAFVLVRK